jgi:hypothetical protein
MIRRRSRHTEISLLTCDNKQIKRYFVKSSLVDSRSLVLEDADKDSCLPGAWAWACCCLQWFALLLQVFLKAGSGQHHASKAPPRSASHNMHMPEAGCSGICDHNYTAPPARTFWPCCAAVSCVSCVGVLDAAAGPRLRSAACEPGGHAFHTGAFRRQRHFATRCDRIVRDGRVDGPRAEAPRDRGAPHRASLFSLLPLAACNRWL